MSLAKITLIGNVGQDPELRYTPSGKAFAATSLAVNRKRATGDGERKEEVDWFRLTAWGHTAEIMTSYVGKGSRLYVEGRFSSRDYVTRDGEKRFSLEVAVTELQLLDSKGERRPGEAGGADDYAAEPSSLDDIPF